jgi:hypothetical protein
MWERPTLTRLPWHEAMWFALRHCNESLDAFSQSVHGEDDAEDDHLILVPVVGWRKGAEWQDGTRPPVLVAAS